MRDRLIAIIKQCACCYSPPCDGDCGQCKNIEMWDDDIAYIADTIIASGIISVGNDNQKVNNTTHYYAYDVIGGTGSVILSGNPTDDEIRLAIINDLYMVDYTEVDNEQGEAD